jgi:hypothetical protein
VRLVYGEVIDEQLVTELLDHQIHGARQRLAGRDGWSDGVSIGVPLANPTQVVPQSLWVIPGKSLAGAWGL